MAMLDPKQVKEWRLDARRHVRYRVHMPITLETRQGMCYPLVLNSLSVAGVELRCDQAAMQSLTPGGRPATPDNKQVLSFCFTLPDSGGEPTPVTGTGRIVHSRRLAQDQFQLGMRFETLTADDLQKLTGFLQECTPIP